MEGTYEVRNDGHVVGSVDVTRQGMFYVIFCKCRLSAEEIVRLRVSFEDHEVDLGIMIPNGGCLELHGRMNVKNAGKGSAVFYIHHQKAPTFCKCVAVCPEEPFGYLSRLENAFLVRKKGQRMLAFPDEK